MGIASLNPSYDGVSPHFERTLSAIARTTGAIPM